MFAKRIRDMRAPGRGAMVLAGAMLAAIGAGQAFAQDITGGKPDFSGVWTNHRAQPGAAGAFTAPTDEMKLTPFGQQARQDYEDLIEGTDHAPGNTCVGYGMPASMLGSGGYPMEWIQRPEQITVIYESHNEIRRFFFDDRIVDPSEVFPERNGYSTGRWEGDRLIVETVNLKTQVDMRYPHSDQAHILEEYYLGEPTEDGLRVLVAELTMTDPVFLEEPFTTVKRWQEAPGARVMSYECNEPDWLDELQELYDQAGLTMIMHE